MFLFRIIKKLIFWGLLIALIVWVAGRKVKGQTLLQVAKGLVASENFDQGVKDLKMFVGGFLKSVGEEIEEDVTDKDRKALDKMIHKKVKEDEHGNSGSKKL